MCACSCLHANIYIHNIIDYYIINSVVTVAGICNSVGGGVLFDIPPRCRCRWRVQYSSLPFTRLITTHASTAAAVVNNTMFYDATRSSPRLVARSRRRWPRSTVIKVRTDSSTEFGSNPILIVQIRTGLDRSVDFNERVTAFTTGTVCTPNSDIKGRIRPMCMDIENQQHRSLLEHRRRQITDVDVVKK